MTRSNQFTFISLNCQSIKNKVLKVLNYLFENDTNIALLQETWLSENDHSILAQISEFGYENINCTRENRQGGGISILYRRNINFDSV